MNFEALNRCVGFGEIPMSDFNPYADNGGTCVGIAGHNYAIIACDTRHSDGYIINTRNAKRIYDITSHSVIGTTSFHPDGLKLSKELKSLALQYNIKNKKVLSTQSLAQATSNKLYSRRFFPFYSFNLICGLDIQTGMGKLYSFDPVGSFQSEIYRSAGNASSIIQPFLDSQVLSNYYLFRPICSIVKSMLKLQLILSKMPLLQHQREKFILVII